MSCGSSTCQSVNSVGFASGFSDAARSFWRSKVWAGIARWFEKWRQLQISIEFEKARQRRVLLGLDDRLLRDIGLTREQVEREVRKPYWK